MVIYSGLWMKVVAFGLISLTIVYVNCTEPVTLFPPVADTKEFTSITLTCSYNGPETALHSHWLNYTYGKTEAFIGLDNDTCIATGFLNDTNNYSWSCNRNSSFSVTIKKVVRTQNGEKWRCRHLFTASKNITILVQVPVTNVKLNDPVENVVTVMENESINFMCNTSYCRPPANVEWLMCPNNCSIGEAVNISIGAENLDITNSIGFSSTISDLDYRPDRSENGWTIHCSASNLIANEVVSRKIKLNVMYPPIGPPVIHGVSHHNTYRVIENNHGFLSCSMTGGNPLPDLVWNCFESDSTEVTNDTTITTSISWKAKRSTNKSCECRSEHIGGNQSVNVYLDVLYPPEIPILMISSVRVNKTVYKIINTSLAIHCKSRSNPAPDYIWTMPDSTTSKGDEVNLIQISMSDNGTYNCRAENTMVSSSGKEESGLGETSINILVLFPPTTPQLRYGNITGPIIDAGSLVVVKKDTFDIACSSSGNPEPDIIWNNKSHNSSILMISSIMNDMSVTCQAKNTMNEFGESHKGTAEVILPIMVLYPPSIPDIKYSNIQGHTTNCTSVQGHLNVNENATFSFICNATARPEASYSWYGEVTSTSSILTIHKVSRYLKGNYSCHAFNTMVRSFGEIERGTSEKSVHLNILYPPEIGQLHNRTVTEGSSVNISCPVRPGKPPETNVTWTRNLDETVWKSKELYIISAKRQDDMIYKCTAYNTMKPSCGNEIKGQASRSFHLKVVCMTYSFFISYAMFYYHNMVQVHHFTTTKSVGRHKIFQQSIFLGH